LFFNWLVGANTPAWIANAKSRPLLESIGATLESLLPDDPENSILKRLAPGEPEADPEAPSTATPPAETPATEQPPAETAPEAVPQDEAPIVAPEEGPAEVIPDEAPDETAPPG
jgi:membrane protein required for colicin V production